MTRSAYITRCGYEALNAELKHLWKVERPQVTQQVHEAAALGDRSENADYIYGKRRLREIDRRVRYLAKRLDILTVVDYSPRQEGRIFFGAYVQLWRELPSLCEQKNDSAKPSEVLNNNTEQQVIYRIVGSDEIEAGLQGESQQESQYQAISVDSPLAKALIGKTLDETICVSTPSGPIEWFIEHIAYQPFSVR